MKRIAMLAVMAILFSVATATAYTDCECTLSCCSCPQPVVKDIPPPPPPPPAPVPPPLPVKERVAVILNILFDFDKAVVKDKYYDDVKKIADLMQEFPDKNITIEGHTDNFGTEEYNQKLSEERANSVRQYLIDKFGINGSRLTAVGYGEEKPIASNDSVEGRQKNRRVEAVLEAIRIK
jgi:OmpA-OmpF porin, OOP family